MVAQVWPPLTEGKHITTFICTLKRIYFKKLVRLVISNFFDLIIIGGQVEDVIRHEKLSDDSTRATEPNTKK